MRTRDLWVLAMAGALVLSGCIGGDDGDGSGGGGNVSTGISKSRLLSDLDMDESVQACESVAEALTSSFDEDVIANAQCTGEAIGVSVVVDENGNYRVDTEMCNQAVSQCLEQTEPQPLFAEEDIDCDSAEASEDLATCDATVGEMEDCLSATIRFVNDTFERLTCSALSREGELERLMNGDLETFDAPECDALTQKCPNVELFEM